MNGNCIIDLHCDVLYKGEKLGASLDDPRLQCSLSRLPPDKRMCQCSAIFMPDNYRGTEAVAYFDRVYAYFLGQMEAHRSLVTQVTDVGKLSEALTETQFAYILTVEGGSALGGELDALYKLQKCGVRMMTLTWNAANEICGGAATDRGFTDFGREVVALMEELGMAADVSHLSDKGFYELCEFAAKPFVASHSNAREICGHRRNLTDDMFARIVERRGLVGLNYYSYFITEDGKSDGVEDLLRHVYHFLELGGENILALGSDQDGGEDMHPSLCRLDQTAYMWDILRGGGIPAETADNIVFKNARRFFKRMAKAVKEE